MTADPTILPRRVLERQARLHQWLQDVPGLSASERQLATWLINRGDGYGDTLKAYKTIAGENGATSPRTAERAVKGLAEKGLLDVEARVGRTGPTSNRLRLRVPHELLELKLSEADLRAGVDPYDAELAFRPAGTAKLAGRMDMQGANLADRREPAQEAVRQSGDAKLADEPSYLREEEETQRPEGSAATLAGRPRPFAGRPRGPRPAADVFAARAAS